NLGDARLCVCNRSHLEHALEVRGCRVFTRGDCKSARGAHTSESDMILWWPYRLFEPHGVECLELVCHRDRLVHRPRTVGIYGDRDVGPGNVARCLDRWDVDLMQLEGAIAALERPIRIPRHRRWLVIA